MLLFRPVPGMRAPALAFVAMGLVFGAFAAFVPVLKAQIGASDAVFGVIFLIGSIGAIASVRLAPWADRGLGALSVPVYSALLGLSLVGAALAPGIISFTVAMLVVSVLAGITDVVMNARISEVEAVENRPLMSLNHGLFSLAYALSAIGTGLAREAGIGPVEVFVALALVNVLMSVFMRAPHLETDIAEATTSMAIPRGLVWIGGVIVLAAFFAELSVEGWSALYIERDLGGGATEGAMGPAILGFTMALGRFFGHLLSRAFSDTTLIAAACLLTAIGAFLAAIAPSPVMAQLGFGVLGLGVSVVVPVALGLVGRSVPAYQRVPAIAKVSAIGYAAFLVGPVFMGGVAEVTSLGVSFLLVGSLMLAVAALLLPLLARRLRLAQTEV